jgi:hypothetical protein
MRKISVLSKVQYHPPEKTVENQFKNDYALLQIPRICLIRMHRDIPLSAVKKCADSNETWFIISGRPRLRIVCEFRQ